MFALITNNRKQNFYLFLILGVAFLLRFYKLGFQSLWLDELYTMNECDPSISWSETLKLVQENECKSPLYYFVVRLFCTMFGYTEFVARSISAIGGVLGVWALYLLGRELGNPRVALIAAVIAAVNPFHIYYSQEARGYIFLFLFSALSYLYFTRFLRQHDVKNSVLYAVFSILALHIHPFAALILFSQAIVFIIYFCSEDYRPFRKIILKRVVLIVVITVVGFLPLLRDFRSASGITEFWIPKPAQDYFFGFFSEFFGNSDLLKPLLTVMLISFLVLVFRSKRSDPDHKMTSYNFVLTGLSLVVIFLVPFLYSILKVPATISRYFISALPLLIFMLAMGLGGIENRMVRNSILSVFVMVSLLNLVVVNRYYVTPLKTQFREMANFVSYYSDKPYRINNQKTALHTLYYMKKYNLTTQLTGVDNEVFVDSVMKAKTDKAFWLTGAHQDPRLSAEKSRLLETRFVLTKSKDFLDAWAMLYRPINDGKNVAQHLNYADFDPKNTDYILGDSVLTIWDGEFRISKPLNIVAGNYVMKINSSGTPFKDIFPHLLVYKNDILLGEFYTEGSYGLSRPINFDVMPDEKPFVLRIRMDNDENNALTKEDRNAFIKSVYFFKD